MSTVFDLDLDGQRVQDERAALNPLSPDAVEVPTFYRTGQAIGGYAMAGFARSARAGMLALSAAPIAYDALAGGTEAQDAWFEATDDLTTDAIKYWTPGAQETGAAGRLLGGVSQMLTSLTAGGIPGLVATETLNTGADLVNDGVGAGTALGAGLIQGVTIGVGGLLPGSGLVAGKLADLALTAGGNAALGIGNRAALGGLLSANGYEAQAQQYKAFDAASIAADVVMGGAFWGMSRYLSREQVDSALTQNSARNAQVDTAPGIPVDAVSSISHQEALRVAIGQISRGEAVNLPPRITEAAFLRNPDDLMPTAPGRDQLLANARQEVEPIYRTELQQQADLQVPNVADLRREMAGLQRTLDGLDDTFRDRAKEFQQQGQGRKAAETSARQAIEQDRQAAQERQQEIAQTMEQNRTAEQARAELGRLDRGEPSAVLDQRSTERADAMAQGFERKPLAAGVAEGNRMTWQQAARAEIGRALADIDQQLVPAREVDDALAGMPGRARAEQDAAQQQGAAPKAEAGQGDSAPRAEQGQQANPADSDPEVQLAQSIVDHLDDLRLPTGAIDAEGQPVTASARQLLADADAAVQQARNDERGFLAAAACFLQRGE